MEQYHIFHSKPNEFMFTETEIQPREYVGFVNANSIEEAFKLSQNIESNWNPTNPCRSTSVGDVIQENDKFFMVCGVGFKELRTEEEIAKDLDIEEMYEDLATIADKEEESKYQQ